MKKTVILSRIPNKLFKYYSFEDSLNSKRLSGEIYFNSPDKFNDLFDAQHQIENNIEDFQDDTYVRSKLKEINFDISSTIESLRNGNESIKLKIRNKQIENVGITCFTETPLSILMWAYYGNNEGYCLEYDSKRIKEQIEVLYEKKVGNAKGRIMGRKVKYGNELPNSKLFVNKGDINSLCDKYFHKSACWKHEKEYRIALSLGGKISLPFRHVVKSITFGYNMSKTNILSLLSIIAKMDDIIEIYFLKKTEEKDGLKRDKFNFEQKDEFCELLKTIEKKQNL